MQTAWPVRPWLPACDWPSFLNVSRRCSFCLPCLIPIAAPTLNQPVLSEPRRRRSVAARGRDRVHTTIAKQMRRETRGLEYFLERRVANAQAAGISAERRHHCAEAVTGKTPPLQRPPAGGDARLRMQVA